MKKFLGFLITLFLLIPLICFGQGMSSRPYILTSSDCSILTFYGVLCQDIDDGKVYKWDGAAIAELEAAAGAYVAEAAYDAQTILMATVDNTPLALTVAEQTVVGRVTGGTINDLAIDADLTAVSAADDTVPSAKATKAYADLMLPLTTYNAQTILQATADNTPLALTVTEQTIVGRATGGNIAALDIDADITAVSANDDTVPSAKATKTYADLKAPIANPTFTGVVSMPNAALKLADTDASHYLIIKPGSDLGADRIFTITTGDAARTLTIGGDSTVNQDVSNTANPAFSTANLTGASALTLGTSRTNDGKITFKSGTALNDFVFTITGGNFGADLAWALPLAAPGGPNYVLNVDADGTMGYTDPATFGGLTSDCAVSPCLDGSADGGTYAAMYDGDSHWTKLAAGNSIANLTFTWPTAASGGNNYLLNFDADGTGGFTDPAGFQTADATLTALAALVIADVTIIAGTGADTVEVVTSGGNYRFLGSNSDNTSLSFQAMTLDLVADTATSQKIAAADVNATGHVTVLTDIDDTGGITVTGLSATRAITVDDAAQELAARNRDNTFTENQIVGNADTDTLSVQSIMRGVGRAVTIDDDATSAPTYATGTNSLFVEGQIESAAGIYAPFFDSVLTAGNVGYTRIKEDPTNGINYRGLTVASALTQDLMWKIPDGVPDANDMPIFSAVVANVTDISYKTLPELMDLVLGNTQGNIAFRNNTTWTVLAPGNAGQALTSGGAAANVTWENVTATAAGETSYIQYNTADALDSEAAFSYAAATNTLSITAEGANPAIQLGNGVYAWGHTPLFGNEGILENDGAAYFDSTVAIADDITLSKAIQLITHSGATSLTITSTNGTVIIEGVTFTADAISGVASIAFGADPADAGAIRLSNATYIMSEADVAAADISVIGVDSAEIIQIGASGASGVTITPAVILTGGITSIGAAADLSGGTVTLGTIAGGINAGAANDLEIPNGDNPTTDTAGQIAMDTTGSNIQGLNVYANATPGAIRVPFYIMGPPITIKDPTATSDYPAFYAPYALTLRAVHYISSGGSWVGQLEICDANYSACGDTQAADTTTVDGTTTNVTAFADATVPAAVWVGIKTTSVDSAPTQITVAFEYTMDQQ